MPSTDTRARRGRAIAAVALAALSAVLLAYGGTLLYVKQEVGREGPFAARLVSSLDDPAVRGVVAERSVDALVSGSARNLVAVRPLMIAALDGLVATRSFRRALTFGIADAHRALVQDRGSVVVEAERTGRLVVGAVRSVSPAVAARTSGDAEPVLARIDRDRTVLRIVRGLIHRASSAWLVLGASLLAALGAVAVSSDRRRTTVHLGAGMVGAGLLVAGMVWLGGRVTTGHAAHATGLATDRDRQALDAAWDALFADARNAALVVALGGLLVAAIAAGAGHPGGAAGHVRARLRAVTVPVWPRRAALVAAGGLCLLEPDLVGRALVVAGGALLLAWGAGDAAGALHGRLRAIREPVERHPGPGLAGALIATGIAALAAGAFVGAGAIALDVPPLPSVAPAPRAGCNGSRTLCDRRLNEILWPATHNSYAAADQPGWYFANQRRDIARQLDDGITALLIDVHWGVAEPARRRVRTDLRAEVSDRNKVVKALGPQAVRTAERLAGRIGGPLTGPRALFLCHTLCELGAEPLGDELAVIRRFLERHPDDVLMVVVEDYVPPERIRAAVRDAGLLGYAASLDREHPLPTLRELVRQGRRLVIFAEKEGGAYPWYMPAFSFIQDTPLGNRSPSDLSCARFRGDADSPVLMLNHWIDRVPPRVIDNERIGRAAFLRRRIERCARERKVTGAVVAVDFYERGAVVGVARELNR